MKKLLLLTTLITFVVLIGCASTNAHIDSSELEFREISSIEYSNPQYSKETTQNENQTKVDESKTSTPTKTTSQKNILENGSKGGMGINWDSYWEVDWIEADGSQHYYDALGCDVPLLEGVYYFSNTDNKGKNIFILFTSEGFDRFIDEYNKSGNLSAFNEAKFKLNNLSFAQLKEALISEKQFTFLQLNRLGILDMEEMFKEMSELFKTSISYMLVIRPYDGPQGYHFLHVSLVIKITKDMLV